MQKAPDWFEPLSYIASGLVLSIVILVKCLKHSGALKGDEFERSLEKTINAEGAQPDRLDYLTMRRILAQLSDQEEPPMAIH